MKQIEKFSYDKPFLFEMKKQKSFAVGCDVGPDFGEPDNCASGQGDVASCAGGFGVEVDTCIAGENTTSGSYCSGGTGAA